MSFKRDESYDDVLMEALRFSEKDRASNRDGVLTKSQKNRLRNAQLGCSLPFWGVALVFVWGTATSHSNEVGIRLIPLILILPLVVALFWYQRHTSEVLRKATVKSVQGRLKLSDPYDKRSQWIEVLETRFNMGGHAYDAFIQGDLYTLYYLSEDGNTLLSVDHHGTLPARRLKNIQKR